MFDSVRIKVRELVRLRRVTFSTHSQEEMENDDILARDVIYLLSSADIIERQRDEETGEWKYLFVKPHSNRTLVVVSKINRNGNVFIITVYLL